MYETSSTQADNLVSRSITMLIDLIRCGKLQRGEKLPPPRTSSLGSSGSPAPRSGKR
ncbi:MAG: hypothetical protein LUE17_03625 [Planctomycetaceae bacterium]|nr:hypothetical protein [Planctomycetaceae bacterium]